MNHTININFVVINVVASVCKVLSRNNKERLKDTAAKVCSEFGVFWWKAVTLIRLTWCSALPDYTGDIHTAGFLLLFPSQEVHHILSLTPKCPPPSTAPPSLNSLPFELSVRGCIRVPISRIRTELIGAVIQGQRARRSKSHQSLKGLWEMVIWADDQQGVCLWLCLRNVLFEFKGSLTLNIYIFMCWSRFRAQL